MDKLKKTLCIAVFSRVWGDKRLGNMVKHDILARSYGNKCVNHCALKEAIAKTCKHIQRTRGLVDFVNKNVNPSAQCCSDSFSGRCRCGYLKFRSLGSPHGGKNEKRLIGRIPGGGKSSPWTAWAADKKPAKHEKRA